MAAVAADSNVKIGLILFSVAILVYHITAFSTASWTYFTTTQPIKTPGTETELNMTVVVRFGPWVMCISSTIPGALSKGGKEVTMDMCVSINQFTGLISQMTPHDAPQNNPDDVVKEGAILRWTQVLGVLSLLAFVPVPVLVLLSLSNKLRCLRARRVNSIACALSACACLLVVAEVAKFWLHMGDPHNNEVPVINPKLGWGLYSEAVCANLLALVAVSLATLASRACKEEETRKQRESKTDYSEYRYKKLLEADTMPTSQI